MPLKHATETFLVLLLGVMILVTGLLLSTLPDLPLGILPWLLLFILSLIYPIALLPFLKSNRADYSFRWLHWTPAIMLLLWIILQFLSLTFYRILFLADLLTWSWALLGVTLAFVLLIAYCFQVVRRRNPRIGLLLLFYVLFAGMGIASSEAFSWGDELQAFLWERPVWDDLAKRHVTGSSSLLGWLVGGPEGSLEPSEDVKEERWREQMRALERRRERIRERLKQREADILAGRSSSSILVDGSDRSETGTGKELSEVDTKPTKLPSSGGGFETLAMGMLALYTGTLHKRAARR